MSEDSHSGPVSRRHWRIWIVGILLLIIIVWFSRYTWLRITYKPQPRDQYWLSKIDALDPAPATAVSFPDAEVLLYDAPWLDSSGRRKPGLPWNLDAPLDGPWDRSRDAVDAMCRYFESGDFEKYRKRLIDLTDKGLAPQDFLGYSSYHHMRNWLFLLVVHARWAMENNDLATARGDWLVALKLGRQFRRQRYLDGNPLESASRSLIAREMIAASRLMTPVTGVRNLADEVYAIVGKEFTFTDIVYRFYYIEKLETDRRYVRHGNGWIDIPTFSGIQVPTAKDRIWNMLSFVYHDYNQAGGSTDKLYDTIKPYRTLFEFESNDDRLRKMEQGGLDGWGSFYGDVRGTARLSCRSRMELEAAITMLAIREFEHNNGRLPDTLDELDPDYCPLPLDCACGGTLNYLPTEVSYILYSCWLDGDDDGGIDVDEMPEESGMGGDKVFTIIHRQEDTYDKLVPERN